MEIWVLVYIIGFQRNTGAAMDTEAIEFVGQERCEAAKSALTDIFDVVLRKGTNTKNTPSEIVCLPTGRFLESPE